MKLRRVINEIEVGKSILSFYQISIDIFKNILGLFFIKIIG